MKSALLFSLILPALLAATQNCIADSDCNSPYEICQKQHCTHKHLFPLLTLEIVSPFVMAIFIALSNAAGIGGGALVLPILIVILSFTEPEAVALSNFLIFIGSIVRFIVSFKDRHPDNPDRPIIHYDYVVLLVPNALLGTLIGVHLNEFLPEVVLIILLVIVLLLVTFISFRKACKIYREEVQRREHKMDTLNQETGRAPTGQARAFSITGSLQSQLDSILSSQRSHFPCSRMCIIWVNFTALLIVSLLRGGKGKSIIGLPRCSSEDWLLQLCFALLSFISSFLAGRIVIRQSNLKRIAGYTLDKKWTLSEVLKLSAFALLVGFISSALGLGGGVVVMPLLLAHDNPPSVSSATSIYIIIYISTSSWIQLWIDGYLVYLYALYFSIFIAGGSILGVCLFSRLVQRTGRQSIVLFILCAMMLVASLIIPAFAIPRTISRSQDGTDIWKFRTPCA